MSLDIRFTEAIHKARPTSGPGSSAAATTVVKAPCVYKDPRPSVSAGDYTTNNKKKSNANASRRMSLVEGKDHAHLKPKMYQNLDAVDEICNEKAQPSKDPLDNTLGSFSIASSVPTECKGVDSGARRYPAAVSRQPASSAENTQVHSLNSTQRSNPPMTPLHRATSEHFPVGTGGTHGQTSPPRHPPTRYLASPKGRSPITTNLSPECLREVSPTPSSSHSSSQRRFVSGARLQQPVPTSHLWWAATSSNNNNNSTAAAKTTKSTSPHTGITSGVFTDVPHKRSPKAALLSRASGNATLPLPVPSKGAEVRPVTAAPAARTSDPAAGKGSTPVKSAKKVNEGVTKSTSTSAHTMTRSLELSHGSASSKFPDAEEQERYKTITRQCISVSPARRVPSKPAPATPQNKDREKSKREKRTVEQPPQSVKSGTPPQQEKRTRTASLKADKQEVPPLGGFAPAKTTDAKASKRDASRSSFSSGKLRKSISGAQDHGSGSFCRSPPTVSPKERSRRSVSGARIERQGSISHGHPHATPLEELARPRTGSIHRQGSITEPAAPKRKPFSAGGVVECKPPPEATPAAFRRTISQVLAERKHKATGQGSGAGTPTVSMGTSPLRGAAAATLPSPDSRSNNVAQRSSPAPATPNATAPSDCADTRTPAVTVKLKLKPVPTTAKSTLTVTNTKSNLKGTSSAPPPAVASKPPAAQKGKDDTDDEDNPLFTRTVYSAPATQPGDEPPALCPAIKYDFNFHTSTWLESDTMVRVPHPNRGLAQGGMRACFEVYHVDETGLSTAMVAKMFRRNIMDVVERDYYNETEMQCVCRVLAEAFTKQVQPLPSTMKIAGGITTGGGFPILGGGAKEKELIVTRPILQYLHCVVVRIPFKYIPESYQNKRTGFFSYKTQDTRELMFVMEPKLKGTFTKYTSNDGQTYYSNETRVSIDEHNKRLAVVHTAEAFSHFSLVESGGSMLVCDLQGVGGYFTDPQIHTIDGECFGMGNMGLQGIRKWMSKHKCNEVCRELKLKSTEGATVRTFENAEKRSIYYKKVQAQRQRAPPAVRPNSGDAPAYKPFSEMTEAEKREYVARISQMY